MEPITGTRHVDRPPLLMDSRSGPLDIAVGRYDRTEAIRLGDVVVAGLDYRVRCLPPGEIFWRALQQNEFDVIEMSMANLIIRKAQGDTSFLGIPVFLAKGFPHQLIFVARDAHIENPEDLAGKRIGLAEHTMTAMVWQKGILAEHFNVDLEDVVWFTGGTEGHQRKDRVSYPPTSSRIIREVPESVSLVDMARRQELDALFLYFHPLGGGSDDDIRCLWPDPRGLIRDYFDSTGFIPVIHTLVIRRETYERIPGVVPRLIEAFCEARDRSVGALVGREIAGPYSLPSYLTDVTEAINDFGPELWTYGPDKNLAAVDTLIKYTQEQGLIDIELTAHDLFAPGTLDGRWT